MVLVWKLVMCYYHFLRRTRFFDEKRYCKNINSSQETWLCFQMLIFDPILCVIVLIVWLEANTSFKFIKAISLPLYFVNWCLLFSVSTRAILKNICKFFLWCKWVFSFNFFFFVNQYFQSIIYLLPYIYIPHSYHCRAVVMKKLKRRDEQFMWKLDRYLNKHEKLCKNMLNSLFTILKQWNGSWKTI